MNENIGDWLALPSLSGQKNRIVACLSHYTGTHVDTIASEIRLPPREILSTLLTLELSSHVNQLPGKHFTPKN